MLYYIFHCCHNIIFSGSYVLDQLFSIQRSRVKKPLKNWRKRWIQNSSLILTPYISSVFKWYVSKIWVVNQTSNHKVDPMFNYLVPFDFDNDSCLIRLEMFFFSITPIVDLIWRNEKSIIYTPRKLTTTHQTDCRYY